MGICPKGKMSDRWLEQCMNFKFMQTEAKTQVKYCRYGREMKHHSNNGKHHIIETKKGICCYTKCRQCFFILSQGYLFILSFMNRIKTWTSIVTWKYWYGCMMLFIWEDLNFSLMLASCIMTIHSWHSFNWEFLAKKLMLNSDHPSYSPDFPPCDFWIFPNWKPLWRVTDFQTLPICRYMWQPFWREFQKRGSSSILKNENTDWLRVLLCREMALKVTGGVSV